MTDHLDRAAEVIAAQMHGLTTPSMCRGIARALEEAGLLVTPERDAAVAALPLPGDGCSCTPHEQSAGGVYTEYLLEYEPACPEHSEHLWDPTQGVWVLRSERDAAVAAKAPREAAEEVYGDDRAAGPYSHPLSAASWLRERADWIEREAGESDADA